MKMPICIVCKQEIQESTGVMTEHGQLHSGACHQYYINEVAGKLNESEGAELLNETQLL